jgi:hypothetical protein
MDQDGELKSAAMAKLLGFLARAAGVTSRERSTGTVEVRAGRVLGRLQRNQELGTQMALQDLRWQRDLLEEEAALTPNGLALQARVIELASQYEQAALYVAEMLREPPVAKLWTAILARAFADGATAVRIELGDEAARHIKISYLIAGAYQEAMTVPITLRQPLLGVVKRAEFVGYRALRPHLDPEAPLPDDVSISWSLDTTVDMFLRQTDAGSPH